MKTRSQTKVKELKKNTQEEGKKEVAKTTKDIKANSKATRKKKVSLSQNKPSNGLNDLEFLKKSSTASNWLVKEQGFEEDKFEEITPDQYGKPKKFTKHNTETAQITEWIDITILEFLEILKEDRKHHKDIEEEEICPIWRWELYDDIFKLSNKEVLEIQKKQLEDPESIDVVKFKDWVNHFYHKGWTEGMLSGPKENKNSLFAKLKKEKTPQYVKWAVCSIIYGEFIGDSPPGSMSWEYSAPGQIPLETYEDKGTWEINYSFRNGIRDGVEYRGTHRIAYVPDTKEGREVLFLLQKWFIRKVTFTVGDSVTTGRSNVVVWNSIHHKTNTHGGTMTYGYPDPTYFNRVKLEMADKGILLEEGEDPDQIIKKGTIFIK